jgi:hypothetical protein
MEATAPTVQAQIVNHQQNDPDVKAPDHRKKGDCVLQ